MEGGRLEYLEDTIKCGGWNNSWKRVNMDPSLLKTEEQSHCRKSQTTSKFFFLSIQSNEFSFLSFPKNRRK